MGYADYIPPSLKGVPNLINRLNANSALQGQLLSNRIVTPSSTLLLVNQMVSGVIQRKLINGANVIRFVYANIRSSTITSQTGSFGGNYGEDPVANSIHIKVGITVTSNINTFPVTFGGKPIGTIAPGGWIESDPISIKATAGQFIYEQVTGHPPMPPSVKLTASTTGGGLAAATYYVKVTSVTDGGESNGSTETNVTTTGVTGSISILIGDQNMQYVNVQQYNIYVSTTTGTEIFVGSVNAAQRSFLYTGQTYAASTTLTSTISSTNIIPVVSSAGFRAGDTVVINSTNYIVNNVISPTSIFIKTAISATSGATVVLTATPPSANNYVAANCILNAANISGEGSVTNMDISYGRTGASLSGGNGFFCAHAIIGTPLNSLVTPKPPVFVMGDSIGGGASDVPLTSENIFTYLGFIPRALADNFPYVNVSVGGETASAFATLGGSRFRMILAQAAKYAICHYGTNDLAGGSTAAQLKANIIYIAKALIDSGIQKYFHCTIGVRNTSTDGWQSLGNQAPGAIETARQTVNQWLRAPYSAGSGNSILFDVGIAYMDKVGVVDSGGKIEYNSNGSLITIDPATGAISNGSGGYWNAFGTTQYGNNLGTISGTTSTLTDSGQSLTVNAWKGYNIAVTISGTTYYTGIIGNTATVFSFTLPIGAVPAAGTTYYIYKAYNQGDGLHPTQVSHIAMAAAIDTSLLH